MTWRSRLICAARAWYLRRCGVALGKPRFIGSAVSCRRGRGVNGPGQIEIGTDAEIDSGAQLHAFGGTIRIGANVFLGPYAVIYGHGGVEIGDDTLIAMHCCIVSSDHTIPPEEIAIRTQPDRLLSTTIGRDVWLGAGVKVLGGVTIGDGCIVGAGAVVTSDLPPRTIAAGVPAKVRKARPSIGEPWAPPMT